MEAASYNNDTQAMVFQLLKHNIICRYGMSGDLITDNGGKPKWENDPATLPTVPDRTQKFGSLLPSNEWCGGSR